MAGSRPSGLEGRKIVIARDMTMQAAALAMKNEPAVHYTQGGARWEGIDKHLKAWRGQYPRFADCSSFATWCIWNGLDHYHVRDVVNNAGWKAGYTGTMLNNGWRVPGGRQLMRGDCVIYGTRWPGVHTALYIGGGKCISHGSERGPHLVGVNNGMPILGFRRYI